MVTLTTREKEIIEPVMAAAGMWVISAARSNLTTGEYERADEIRHVLELQVLLSIIEAADSEYELHTDGDAYKSRIEELRAEIKRLAWWENERQDTSKG